MRVWWTKRREPASADLLPARREEVLTFEQIRWLNDADAHEARAKCEELEMESAAKRAADYEAEGNHYMAGLQRKLVAAKSELVVTLRNNARQARHFAGPRP